MAVFQLCESLSQPIQILWQTLVQPSDSRSGADNHPSLTAVHYGETLSNDLEIQSNFKMGQAAQILSQNQAKIMQCVPGLTCWAMNSPFSLCPLRVLEFFWAERHFLKRCVRERKSRASSHTSPKVDIY